MIWSVSTLLRLSGIATPVWVVNLSMSETRFLRRDGGEVGRRGERAAHGRRRRHGHRHEVGPAALALASLEVAVGGGGTALPRRQLVGVHAQAHRAPRT